MTIFKRGKHAQTSLTPLSLLIFPQTHEKSNVVVFPLPASLHPPSAPDPPRSNPPVHGLGCHLPLARHAALGPLLENPARLSGQLKHVSFSTGGLRALARAASAAILRRDRGDRGYRPRAYDGRAARGVVARGALWVRARRAVGARGRPSAVRDSRRAQGSLQASSIARRWAGASMVTQRPWHVATARARARSRPS